MLRRILFWVATVILAAIIFASTAYVRDMNRAYERVREKSTVIPSPFGDIEYTDRGTGPAVLVVHGSGGGFDQGELIAQAVLEQEFHWIVPSRFGYLRSGFHAGATWDDQANAYAYLLDRAGVEKVAVVAMSQGGPSALLFALLHPERVSSLTLISCGVAPSSENDQALANEKGNALTTIFKHDLAYWLVSRLFRKKLMELIGASGEIIDDLTADQRVLFDRFIDEMNPVSLRSEGVILDNTMTLPGERIRGIEAPTLILHAVDDTLQLFRNAEFAAENIPNARLVRFESGGHFLIGVEKSVVHAIVRDHILDNDNDKSPTIQR